MMIKKITLILLMFIWFLPFLIMLLIAFNSQNTLFFSDLLNISNITFSNFTNAWQEANFSQYFLNTIIITISSVIIILCITSLAGYIMGREIHIFYFGTFNGNAYDIFFNTCVPDIKNVKL